MLLEGQKLAGRDGQGMWHDVENKCLQNIFGNLTEEDSAEGL
jgi:hypothetical protein